jgi:CheY-like chemotaxis protein
MQFEDTRHAVFESCEATSDLLADRRRTVLVADDEPMIRALTARLLHTDGFDVCVARDGDDLLRQVHLASLANWPHDGFDVIVSDIDMPGRDGVNALEDLRARMIFTPVIFITGGCDGATMRRARALGESEPLRKPFDAKTLRSAVRAACASRHARDGF